MRKVLLLFLCSGISLTTLVAQDSNKQLLDKLVEKQVLTQSEADELSKESLQGQQNLIERTSENIHHVFKNIPFVNIGGYGMLMHNYNSASAVKHSSQVRVLFVTIRGKVTDNIGYFVLGELADPTLYEFNVDWTPYKQFNLKVGQAKTPIGLENQMSLTEIEAVFNTRSVSSLIGMNGDVQQLQNGRNNTGRDVGVLAYGSLIGISDHHLLQYGVGVYQGNGISALETNNTKDLSTSLLFQPVKGFRIGGSTYFGEATYLKPGDARIEDHVRNRWVISGDYKSDRVSLRAEWLHGKDGGIGKEGLYGVAQYYIVPKKFNVAGKIDYFNQDKKDNNEVVDYLVGFDYYFYNRCRIQLNYQYSDYSSNWGEQNSHRVIGQVQVVF